MTSPADVPRYGTEDVLVLEGEGLLRSVVCDALEQALPRVRARPAGTVEEAARVLESWPISQMVSEVLVEGANVSAWLTETLEARPLMALVTFSVQRPWLPADLRESPRVAHVEKRAGSLRALVETCDSLLT